MRNQSYPKDYEDYFRFLDMLRLTGITNMYGATPYLINAFPYLAEDEAKAILITWMKTFSERHRKS